MGPHLKLREGWLRVRGSKFVGTRGAWSGSVFSCGGGKRHRTTFNTQWQAQAQTVVEKHLRTKSLGAVMALSPSKETIDDALARLGPLCNEQVANARRTLLRMTTVELSEENLRLVVALKEIKGGGNCQIARAFFDTAQSQSKMKLAAETGYRSAYWCVPKSSEPNLDHKIESKYLMDPAPMADLDADLTALVSGGCQCGRRIPLAIGQRAERAVLPAMSPSVLAAEGAGAAVAPKERNQALNQPASWSRGLHWPRSCMAIWRTEVLKLAPHRGPERNLFQHRASRKF
eukprot:12431473-Karenia_brevis.AAC.1